VSLQGIPSVPADFLPVGNAGDENAIGDLGEHRAVVSDANTIERSQVAFQALSFAEMITDVTSIHRRK
jgi:hypothetical protein